MQTVHEGRETMTILQVDVPSEVVGVKDGKPWLFALGWDEIRGLVMETIRDLRIPRTD
jgi:hypothetical protein